MNIIHFILTWLVKNNYQDDYSRYRSNKLHLIDTMDWIYWIVDMINELTNKIKKQINFENDEEEFDVSDMYDICEKEFDLFLWE